MPNISHLVSNQLINLSEKFKFDINDPNLIDTPNRVEKAFNEMLSGYNDDPAQILSKKFPSEKYDQMIVVKNIKFYSLCAHHLLPFYGFVSIGYIPNEEKAEVVGLSKLPRLVKCFSRRLQIQERMTQQIAKQIDYHLNPRGVGVLIHDCIHLCSHMRGVEESHSTMETSALYGEFRDDPSVRAEFLRMVK